MLARAAVVEALRLILKRKKLTYADAAQTLEVSEQTIKRFFAGDDFPMSRLLALCEFAQISFFDLVAAAKEDERERVFELTIEQEEFFVSYPHFFLFFSQLRDGKTATEIKAAHRLSDRSLARYLKQLEDLGLIERLGGTGVRLKVDGGLNLRKNGPLSRWIGLDQANQMLRWVQERPTGSIGLWNMTDAHLQPTTIAALKRELEELGARYRKLAQREENLVAREELRPVGWLVALASPWEVQLDASIVDI